MNITELEIAVLQAVMDEQGDTGKAAVASRLGTSLSLGLEQLLDLLQILQKKDLVSLARTSDNIIAFIEPEGRLLLSQREGLSASVIKGSGPGLLTGHLIRVAFLGMTGAGKSSLINTLLGVNLANVNALRPGTRTILQLAGRIDSHNVLCIDCPGLGWEEELDREYFAIYKQLLNDVSCICWVMRSDTRVRAYDITYFKELHVLAIRAKAKICAVLNYCDRVSPDDWNFKNNQPSGNQDQSLQFIQQLISGSLHLPMSRIICTSGYRKYNIDHLKRFIVD
jgi:GTP-binding protein EngB required for normal cell division